MKARFLALILSLPAGLCLAEDDLFELSIEQLSQLEVSVASMVQDRNPSSMPPPV